MSANPAFPAESTPHHLIIAFAACSAEAWRPTLQALPPASTRHLSELLRGMKQVHTDAVNAHTLSPPHERALARALGLASPSASDLPDGLIPWAALEAAQAFHAPAGKAWASITPCHWAMGREHATLTDPAGLALQPDESQALIDAMQPYFATDGITLHGLSAQCWLAEGEVFRTLPTASLDRVMGRNVDSWLPHSAAGRSLRRLQNEMQMLLYTHPLNDARAARRQLPVNSFWVSGTGALPDALPASSPPLTMPRTLAEAVFRDDWAAYAQAWAALDAGDIASLLARQRAGETVRITLCGERGASTHETSRHGLRAKLAGLFASKPLLNGLEQL